MAVTGADAVAMIHHDRLAISAKKVRESDHAIRRRYDRVAVVAADIYTTVKCAFAVERVNALPKAARHLAFHRPQVRSGVGAVPVGGGRISRHAQADTAPTPLRTCGRWKAR